MGNYPWPFFVGMASPASVGLQHGRALTIGITLGGQDGCDPIAVWKAATERENPWPVDNWIGLPNAFTCPLGSDPGVGHVLMSGVNLSHLDIDALQDLAFNIRDTVSGTETAVTLKSLVIVRAETIVAGADPASQSLQFAEDAPYLVELADRRRLYCGIPINKAYNIRYGTGAAEFFPGTLNSGSTWTWETMIADIVAVVGKIGSPALPFTPDGTPENFNFYGSGAWHALDTVLTRVGCTIQLDPTTDTIAFVQVANAADATARGDAIAAQRRCWDTRPVRTVRGNIPASVRIHFPKFPVPDCEDSPWYTIDEADPAPTGTPETGTYALIYDQLPALYDDTGTLTNIAALTSRAVERAADYFREMHLDPVHPILIGMQSASGLPPSGAVRATRWEDRGTGYKTELIWFPRRPCAESKAGIFDACCGAGGGTWFLGVTAVTLGADQNNYPTPSTAVLRIEATTNITITGLSGGLPGQALKVESASTSAGTITLPHESGSSTASNRIHSSTLWSEVLDPGESRLLEKDRIDNRWYIFARVAGPAMPVAGAATIASVTGALAVDTTGGSGTTSPASSALSVYYAAAWHCTGGGGTIHVTGDRTFVASDYTQCMDYRLATGGAPTVQTLPTTTPLDECWHSFQYNDPHYGTPATVLYVLESSPGTLFGLAFAGGGSWLFSHGGGEYIGVPIEPLRGVVPVTGATYTVKPEDENQVLDCTNAAGCAISVPQSSNSGNFPASFRFCVKNRCAGSTGSPYGVVTVTPTTSTIDGKTLLNVFPRCTVEIVADGTDYKTERGRPPGGILEWSGASITLQGAHHLKLLVYTGSGDTDVNGDGTSTSAGLRVGIRNATSSQGIVRFNRADGGIDYIPPGQAYDLYVPDNDDAGTTNYAMTGLTEFGTNPKSANYTITRSDQGRGIECTGSSDFTITGFTITSNDVKFAFAIKNNTSGKTITFSPGGGQTVNGATSLRIDACQGVWIFADSANTRWVAITGIACPQYGSGVPSHTAPMGTLYWRSGTSSFYVNNNGSTGWTAIGGSASPLTTKGDIWVYSTTDTRLAIGTTGGYVLTPDSTQATGMKWDDISQVMIAGGYSFAQSIIGGGSPTSTDNYADNFYSFGSLAVLFAVKNTGANVLEWSIDVVDAFGSSHAGAATGTIAAGTEFDWNSRDKISTYSRTYGTWTIYFRSFVAGFSTTFDIAYSRIG